MKPVNGGSTRPLNEADPVRHQARVIAAPGSSASSSSAALQPQSSPQISQPGIRRRISSAGAGSAMDRKAGRSCAGKAAGLPPALPAELNQKVMTMLASDCDTVAAAPALVALRRVSKAHDQAYKTLDFDADHPGIAREFEVGRKNLLRSRQQAQHNLAHEAAWQPSQEVLAHARLGMNKAFKKNNFAPFFRKSVADVLKPFRHDGLLVLDFNVIPRADWAKVMQEVAQFPGNRDITLIADRLSAGAFCRHMQIPLLYLIPRLSASQAERGNAIRLSLHCRHTTWNADALNLLGSLVEHYPSIKALDLSGSTLQGSALEWFFALVAESGLVKINLSNCALHDGTSSINTGIAQIFSSDRLEECDLSGNKLGSEFCFRLGLALFGGKRLARLNLDGNALQDDDLEKLMPALQHAGKRQLDHVSIRNNNLSRQNIAEISARIRHLRKADCFPHLDLGQ